MLVVVTHCKLLRQEDANYLKVLETYDYLILMLPVSYWHHWCWCSLCWRSNQERSWRYCSTFIWSWTESVLSEKNSFVWAYMRSRSQNSSSVVIHRPPAMKVFWVVLTTIWIQIMGQIWKLILVSSNSYSPLFPLDFQGVTLIPPPL